MFVEVTPQTFHAGAFTATGKDRTRIHRSASEIVVAAFTDRPVALEDQSQSVETRMTTGAALVFSVPRQHFAQRQITKLPLVSGQLGNLRWGWRNLFSQNTAHHPIAALD